MPIGPKPGEVEALLAEYRAAGAAADLTPGPTKPASDTPRLPSAINSEQSSLNGALNSSKLPGLSQAEVQSAREAWVNAGKDAAEFDAAMRADGFTLPTPPNVHLVRAHQEYNLPLNPTASLYEPKMPQDFQAQPGTMTELGEFAAALGMSKELGEGVIGHLAEIGPAYRAMSDSQKTAWLAREQQTGIRLAGGQKEYNAVRERALEVLKGTNKAVATALAGNPVVNSWWLLKTLSLHGENLAAFAKRRR